MGEPWPTPGLRFGLGEPWPTLAAGASRLFAPEPAVGRNDGTTRIGVASRSRTFIAAEPVVLVMVRVVLIVAVAMSVAVKESVSVSVSVSVLVSVVVPVVVVTGKYE